MPHVTKVVTRDGLPMTYDSGDYVECQRRALAAAGWSDFARAPRGARREGRCIGIGLSNYVEGMTRAVQSAASASGHPGQISVTTGAAAQGQGTYTMLAQLPRRLGVAPAAIRVIAAIPRRARSATAPMRAARRCRGQCRAPRARQVADKARAAATAMLEVAPDDLELVDGFVRVRGVPELKRSLGESRMRSAASRDSRCRPTSRPGSPPRSTTSHPRSPTPTARMSPRSRSTLKPATCASRVTSWCTTAGA